MTRVTLTQVNYEFVNYAKQICLKLFLLTIAARGNPQSKVNSSNQNTTINIITNDQNIEEVDLFKYITLDPSEAEMLHQQKNSKQGSP